MLVLLDIDGVMVPAHSWKSPEFLADGFYAFSKKAVPALQKLISDTGADVVLTTSHRYRFSLFQWHQIFKSRGLQLNKISRLPENEGVLTRKEEILSWHSVNPSTRDFVIIDDDKALNDLPLPLKEKLILTSGLIGLTTELADEAIDVLKGRHNSVPA